MIIDSETLIPIEEHFKISAGPGAGKTYWLTKHIKNVLQNSKRLSSARKIACITYTNIGVESILKKLGTNSNYVEVSTIHSFLYKHVLKPYCSFISNEYELNIDKLNGHCEPYVNFANVVQWIKNHPRKDEFKHPYNCNQLLKRKENRVALNNWLSSLTYKFDKNKRLIINGNRSKAISIENKNKKARLSNKCLRILESDLLEYKKLYWREGIIDHDDVLFFSYQVMEEYPFILTVLRAKFPYFFIDEFQDTNPIQFEIIKKIGEEETIVGVIGDSAQSIYGFQGVKSSQFDDFLLEGLKKYTMVENRRSTNKIIDVLNYVRKDIHQKKYRDVEGDKPTIIVGECKESYKKAKILSENEDVYSLSRKNVTSNAMKEDFEDIKTEENVLEQLIRVDSNNTRRYKIISCISAVEYARAGQYKEVMRKLRFLASNKDNLVDIRKKIIGSLYLLVNKYDFYKNSSLMTFYDVVKENIDNKLSGFQKNKGPYVFYSENKYKELAIFINNINNISKHRTIHKAKGDEFENVMLILEDEKDLDFLLNSDLTNNEEHRIYYVAISRAMKRLFINVPSLSREKATSLSELFEIIELNK